MLVCSVGFQQVVPAFFILHGWSRGVTTLLCHQACHPYEPCNSKCSCALIRAGSSEHCHCRNPWLSDPAISWLFLVGICGSGRSCSVLPVQRLLYQSKRASVLASNCLAMKNLVFYSNQTELVWINFTAGWEIERLL